MPGQELLTPQDYAKSMTGGTDLAGMDWSGQATFGRANPDMWDAYWNSFESQTNRIFNASEAEKSRVWSKMMSDTTYQRAVEDLKKAGINPLYMFMGSGSGSTPSGQSATGSAANLGTAGHHKNILGQLGMIIMAIAKLLA